MNGVGALDLAAHLCALAALGYAGRVASFASTWLQLPALRSDPGALPSLSIVVPARDEARSIERCVRSLLAQRFLDFEVIVVDDRSSDATAAIVEALAHEDPRLHLVRGEPLPDGWVGKPWALVQGVARARGAWLLFTDADSAHEPSGAASALWFATRAGVDALSLGAFQELETLAERAILPSILGTIVLATGPLGAINDPAQPERALANGQYLLVARHAYEALGGHAALHDEIVEDIAFARRLKRDGRFRLFVASAPAFSRVRMYRSFGEIRAGFEKNLFIGAGGSVRALLAGIAALLLVSAAPPLVAVAALARRRPVLALECA
ncbi:MAG: glycosyltransferase, partial [Vulcanimicrobiaceae bacterium]